MKSDITTEFKSVIDALIMKAGLHADPDRLTVTALGADGSDRLFLRLGGGDFGGSSTAVAMAPGRTNPAWREESRASYLIGRHLHERGVPVPMILGYDEASSAILFEDVGDEHLQRRVVTARQENACADDETLALYRSAVDVLVQMQTAGAIGFDSERYCWDTPRYDAALMMTRESLYFYEACCVGLAGMTERRQRLIPEFQTLADRAASAPSGYLLHRDYQSRNLMLHNGRLRVIDYQGARFGPLAYDLASLLIDPYVGLDHHMEEELLQYYASQAKEITRFDIDHFLDGYYYIFLQRNLQIIGAYANLGYAKGKIFFRRFLLPAIKRLQIHLGKAPGREFPELWRTAEQLCASISEKRPWPG